MGDSIVIGPSASGAMRGRQRGRRATLSEMNTGPKPYITTVRWCANRNPQRHAIGSLCDTARDLFASTIPHCSILQYPHAHSTYINHAQSCIICVLKHRQLNSSTALLASPVLIASRAPVRGRLEEAGPANLQASQQRGAWR
jgi:hypothetical protein